MDLSLGSVVNGIRNHQSDGKYRIKQIVVSRKPVISHALKVATGERIIQVQT